VTIDSDGLPDRDRRSDHREEADFVLAVKENQPTLYAGIEAHFLDHLDDDFARVKVSRHETNEHGHGRDERRDVLCCAMSGPPSRPRALEGIEADRDRDQ